MSNRRERRRYRKSPGRRVWVFSELNTDLRPEHVAKIITSAGLEQARLEAEARAQREPTEPDDVAKGDGDHA
jgi:hypothetical protein